MPTDLMNLRATYRVQVNAGFTLTAAAAQADYLARLGISHLYTSPILQAAPGSNHGYDVVDPTRVNAELGGADALERLTQALKSADLGYILDIVPNHMAITGAENPWWWDLLENGPASRYATYFDVEWNPTESRHENQVLAPILGDHYGRVLEANEIRLDFDGRHFTVRYYDHAYPVDPKTLAPLLSLAAEDARSDVLAFLADSYGLLPQPTATDRRSARRRYRDQAVLGTLLNRLCLEEPSVRGAIDRTVNALNADVDLLDAFLADQNYRLTYWRISGGELGYRRFFDINTLIGLRMEDEQVYADTHALILGWLAEGRIHGLRIDHPDGMRDPGGYFARLHDAAPEAWLVIEKILEQGETLPQRWPIHGTTGYDFLNVANGIFVDPRAKDDFTQLYTDFTGEDGDYAAVVRDKKFQVMREVLGSDVARLVSLLGAVAERHRRHRDYTSVELRSVIMECAANMPVYRTYVHPEAAAGLAADAVSTQDGAIIDAVIAAGKERRADLSDDLFDFMAELLCLRLRGDAENEFVSRFQQFTGPVMAKGVEDTTFYTYNRFISLNEVGGDPGHFGVSLANFHAHNAHMQAHWPQTMLAGSTHDTKRSEDVRARLNVLSEVPAPWAAAVTRWAQANEKHKRNGLPDRNTEYLLYQTLVGAWPLSEERALPYIEKAVREAKVHTSWTQPDADYEEAVAAFVSAILADDTFTADLAAFVDEIKEAGWVNSLVQTLLRLTSPGVPDIYQGTELWDLSLVDPDNRRPVDYALRRHLLDELETLSPEAIWARADEGLPKLWLIRQTLALRAQRPHLFGAESSYRPIDLPGADRLIAYARGEEAIVLAPRFVLREGRTFPDAVIDLPDGVWQNVFTGESIHGRIELDAIFARFPVALLWRE